MLKRITCLFLAAVLFCSAVFCVSASTVTSGPLNVRSSTSTDSTILGSLAEGASITVLEIKQVGDYTWGRVFYSGTNTGWIRLDFTDFDVDAVCNVTIVDGPLRVRSQATTDSTQVGTLDNGVSVTVLELKEVNGYTWGRITLSGDVVGWIRLDFTNYDPYTGPENDPNGKGTWVEENGKYYYYIDGQKATGWQKIGGSWYYLDGNGVMQTGWLKLADKTYYLRDNGKMATGLQTVDGSIYYFDADGVMTTGWQTVGGNRYYFAENGKATIGWLEQDGKKYYFGSNGVMVTGKYYIDGQGYIFGSDGALQGMIRAVSQQLVDLLKLEEGFSKYPYWDYTQYTVGYGTECPSDKLALYQSRGITEAEAEALLRKYLAGVEENLEDFEDRYGLYFTQRQYDALVLFSYNVGSGWMWEYDGTFHLAIKNQVTGNELIRAFSIWSSAGGDFKTFLMRRRLSEANIYLNGIYDYYPPDNYSYVLYDANGGTVSPKVQGYDSNLATAPMSYPTNGDYVFGGWYTSKTGGTLVTNLDDSCKTKTLYARWLEPGTETPDDPDTDPTQPGTEPTQPTDPAGTLLKRPVVVTVNTDDVNLRKGPGTDYGALDAKPKAQTGDKLTILETAKTTSLTWGRFYEHGGGWICLDYTNFTAAQAAQNATSGWLQLGDDWYYYQGTEKHIGWLQVGKTWYYMDANGVMVTGEVTIEGKKHNFHSSGTWLGEVFENGWVKDGDKWYYYIEGQKKTGWMQVGNIWYYFQADGRMHTGWLQYGKVWYYLKPSGEMQTGWLQYGSKWCYFDGNGVMVTGEKTIGPVTHKFDANGYWLGVK